MKLEDNRARAFFILCVIGIIYIILLIWARSCDVREAQGKGFGKPYLLITRDSAYADYYISKGYYRRGDTLIRRDVILNYNKLLKK